jgi:hypothetical protein
MRKHFLFLFTLLIVSGLTAQAQLKFGLKAGLNMSKVSYSGNKTAEDWYNSNVENLTGFQVGPMVEFTVPILGVGGDAAILYSQEGFKINSKDLLGGSYKMSNLEVPLNLKYKLSFLGVVGAFATVGPYFKFKLSDDLKEQFESKSFGTGLGFGIGVELLSQLQVGVAYKLGLTDDYSQLKGLTDVTDAAAKSKTRLWTVSAAYLF